MKLILRRLTAADENAFKQAHQEFVEPGCQFDSSFDASQPFAEWLAHKKDKEDPAKVASGRVPVTLMCGFVADEVVGNNTGTNPEQNPQPTPNPNSGGQTPPPAPTGDEDPTPNATPNPTIIDCNANFAQIRQSGSGICLNKSSGFCYRYNAGDVRNIDLLPQRNGPY